jgi:dipeptidase E
MKLLLTSNGLSNDSIAKAFQQLIGKDPKDAKVAFIPTASNPERGNKSWLIDDMYRIKEQGYAVDVVELTALKSEMIKNILEGVDAIFVGGGNTFYLSYWMQQKGLFELLPELLKTKVYAGISAGSIITGANMRSASDALANIETLKDEDYDLLGPEGESSSKTLKFADFVFRPHLNSAFFPLVTKEKLSQKSKYFNVPIYALDDESALKVVDGKVEVISEGDWLMLNGSAPDGS